MRKFIFLILAMLLLTGCDFLFSNGGGEEVYVVDVSIDSGVNVVPLRAVAQRGEKVTFTYILKDGYVLSNILANGVILTPSSNSFSVASVTDQVVSVSTEKDSLLWPILNVIWDLDSVYIDLNRWDSTNEEILNFSSDGTSTALKNGNLYNRNWSLDRSKSPAKLTYGGRQCKLEKISNEKLNISYINELNQKVTQIYGNHGYKK
ncbi:MAG: hypothetical protein US34_C0017G0005 [Candidatus Nomurabacteria bacterium GW2011_GWC2_36_9]|nr:MAG: hypothetical protein US34_C0017G0005 [Candidatus Nomurabacteria bacterium GW2011_GWC2_36_9]